MSDHLETATDAPEPNLPWRQKNAQGDVPNHQLTLSPDDPESPLRSLAMLSSFLQTRKCSSSMVPSDVRDLVRQLTSSEKIQLNDKFLTRLKELNAVSDAYIRDLEQLIDGGFENQPDFEKELQDNFLDYIFRRGMTALLNLLKVWHEAAKISLVRPVLDLIKSRRYLAEDVMDQSKNVVDHGSFVPEAASSVMNVDVKSGRLYEGKRIYRMKSKPKGYVLIINNENFDETSTSLKFRTGTHIDGDRLAKLFDKLGFRLYQGKLHWNLTKKEMKDLVQEFSRYNGHEHADASVVIILSHGHDEGRIYGTDGDYIREQDVREYFTAPNCPSLAEKPKIFLLVACRGGNNDNGLTLPDPVHKEDGVRGARGGDGDGVEADTRIPFSMSAVPNAASVAKIPSHVDFFVAYATVPGYVNIRDLRHGTWFVDDFVQVVTEEAHINDLAAMACEVNDRMSKRSTPELGKQSLLVMTTLRKNLFFNPGY